MPIRWLQNSWDFCSTDGLGISLANKSFDNHSFAILASWHVQSAFLYEETNLVLEQAQEHSSSPSTCESFLRILQQMGFSAFAQILG